MPPEADPFDPNPLISRLAKAGVDFVIIGGVAGAIHGSAYGTYDLDIAYGRDPENLARLIAVLRDVGAKLRVAGGAEDLPFQLEVRTLEAGANFTFDTRFGSLDILEYMPGAPRYEVLRRGATVIRVAEHDVRVAGLDHLIGMKEAAGRTKDKLHASEYRVISDLLRAPKD